LKCGVLTRFGRGKSDVNSQPDMTGPTGRLFDKAVLRLVALFTAVLIALSLPLTASGADISGAPAALPGHMSLGSLSSPDETFVLPVTETTSEVDRTRSDPPPLLFSDPALSIQLVTRDVALAQIGPAVLAPRAVTMLPPGRGPPPSFPHA
jgi:hypothetical protein